MLVLMDTDLRALAAMTQVYFDAAYEMDADKFATIFHPASSVSSVTRVGDEITVNVTPIEAWLGAVRSMKAPKQLGLERRDELLGVDIMRDMAVVKVRLQIPPRYFADLLSCVRLDGVWRIVQKVTTSDTRPSGQMPQ
jgi:hypothetical protein